MYERERERERALFPRVAYHTVRPFKSHSKKYPSIELVFYIKKLSSKIEFVFSIYKQYAQ